jgi:hypothetical protein
LSGYRIGEPEGSAVGRNKIVRGDQFSGGEFIPEEDRRTDRDAVSRNGRGDIEILA